MPLVAGIDFGTASVRVSLVDSDGGKLASASSGYPVIRDRANPDHASQRHADHLRALALAARAAIRSAKVRGEEITCLGIATTGSTVLPVNRNLEPLDDYYLWCDHRGKGEAEEITRMGQQDHLRALEWCGGVYSPEMAWAKVLHWLRHHPAKRNELGTFIEHCDMAVAELTGVTDVPSLRRGVCAAGHKWMWNEDLGGLPGEEFLERVDPCLKGIRAKMEGTYLRATDVAGRLSEAQAKNLGLRAGIPVAAGVLDAHSDAIGAGIRSGDIINVIGTSTCVMAVTEQARPIPGIFGVAQGSIHPHMAGVEAGLSAVGDIFEAIAKRAGQKVDALCRELENFAPGRTGLLRLTWDNGDRNVLANPHLGGVTLGWNLQHSAHDELFAAIEGTAFHTRIIFERLAKYQVPIARVIHAGGIPQKNEVLNQVYANVLNKPVLVPQSDITGLGPAIFAAVAGGIFPNIEAAQAALCPKYRTVRPDPSAVAIYNELFNLYRQLYFSFGSPESEPARLGRVLLRLTELAHP